VIPTLRSVLEEVCLPEPGIKRRYPDLDIQTRIGSASFRWGEQQRVGFRPPGCSIHPRFVVLDEATSALDRHHRKAPLSLLTSGDRLCKCGSPPPLLPSTTTVLELDATGGWRQIPAADYTSPTPKTMMPPSPSARTAPAANQPPPKCHGPRGARPSAGVPTPSGSWRFRPCSAFALSAADSRP